MIGNSPDLLGFVLVWALRFEISMPSALHHRILAVLRARPSIVVTLLAAAEPERREYWLGHRWIAKVDHASARAIGIAQDDVDRSTDLVILLYREDLSVLDPTIAIIVECQLGPDPEKRYRWVDYLAAIRREHHCSGRVLVLSPFDSVLDWARGLFVDEPWLTPTLVGRDQMPRIDDHGRALREPLLAVLSAAFHGLHERGDEVVLAAALAVRTLPRHRRHEYIMLLDDLLPEEIMSEVRRISLEEVEADVEEWMRRSASYQRGVRAGREEGREAVLRGRHEALGWILEARGLTPSAEQQARIDACNDLELLDRWCTRAKTATRVDELFD